ncbi:hypothetical protein [Streptomyces olivochromogenes]|uniref:hypothetical protein n=1 Tax=Streptomyces olivochromogenes TaxID=1963 RepID=UPI001F26FBCE|nr:hypothetical protein [Streptomyces olivochromogenes]
MGIRGRAARLGCAVTAAALAAVMGITACGPTGSGTDRPRHGKTKKVKTKAAGAGAGTVLTAGRGQPAGPGGACVFVKPDGAQKFGHVGWGFRIAGTKRWEYGAVENPTNKLYTPPGGDIGAWHAQGSYDRMLDDMARDAFPQALGSARTGGTPIPGKSTHPYSRYRCTSSSTSDVRAARRMIRTVEGRGFLVGVDPRTGELTSRDCLDATYDVLKAYRTEDLTPAPRLYIPNVWVETLVTWSDGTLTRR